MTPNVPEPDFRAQRVGRGERIRTFDLLNPIQVRYQTALRPDREWQSTTGRHPALTAEQLLNEFSIRTFRT